MINNQNPLGLSIHKECTCFYSIVVTMLIEFYLIYRHAKVKVLRIKEQSCRLKGSEIASIKISIQGMAIAFRWTEPGRSGRQTDKEKVPSSIASMK